MTTTEKSSRSYRLNIAARHNEPGVPATRKQSTPKTSTGVQPHAAHVVHLPKSVTYRSSRIRDLPCRGRGVGTGPPAVRLGVKTRLALPRFLPFARYRRTLKCLLGGGPSARKIVSMQNPHLIAAVVALTIALVPALAAAFHYHYNRQRREFEG